MESLKAIADTVAVTMETAGLVPDMWFGTLEKKRSRAFDAAPGGETGRPYRAKNVGAVAIREAV